MCETMIRGLRYPAATNAWGGGIQSFSSLTARLSFGQPTHESSYTICCERKPSPGLPDATKRIVYWLVPQCVRSNAGWQVRYYLALNGGNRNIDWAVSPARLDDFLLNAGMYYEQATKRGVPAPSRASCRLPGRLAAARAWLTSVGSGRKRFLVETRSAHRGRRVSDLDLSAMPSAARARAPKLDSNVLLSVQGAGMTG